MKSVKNLVDNKISSWVTNYNKGLSSKYYSSVSSKLDPLLSGIFGYYALLYSKTAKILVEDKVIVKNSVLISDDSLGQIQCKYEELPIATDSIDLAVVPEVLEKSQYPHQILREIERVLIPEGYLVLIISNPISWFGLKNIFIRMLSSTRDIPKLVSRKRIDDWCQLLGLEVVERIPLCIGVENKKSKSMSLVDKTVQITCQYFSNYYILVAKKKISTLTPIRPSWKSNPKLVRPRLAEPSVNSHVEDCYRQIKG